MDNCQDFAQVQGRLVPQRVGLCSLLLLLVILVTLNLSLTLWLIATLHFDLVTAFLSYFSGSFFFSSFYCYSCSCPDFCSIPAPTPAPSHIATPGRHWPPHLPARRPQTGGRGPGPWNPGGQQAGGQGEDTKAPGRQV